MPGSIMIMTEGICGIEQGLNKNVPGMYYFDKLPARIKIKNGKEYTLQYGPGQGSLYIEIKEDYDNKMLKRHKITINW